MESVQLIVCWGKEGKEERQEVIASLASTLKGGGKALPGKRKERV